MSGTLQWGRSRRRKEAVPVSNLGKSASLPRRLHKAITAAALLVLFAGFRSAAGAEVVIDFEQSQVGKPVTNWVEQGVVFTLARSPTNSQAAGRIMFFPHLGTKRKGLLCAMATEPIPVQARFPTNGASSVTMVLWGSTGCPALLEAFDAKGQIVDKASVAVVPGRTAPGDPVPFFKLTVNAPNIAFVRFSGPRAGEFLVADELRFTPAARSAD